MLSTIPLAVNYAVRQVVLRHPNSMACAVWRKSLTRTELDGNGNPQSLGGIATIGGAGVIDSEDETEFDYEHLGDGRMLMVGIWEPTAANDRGDNDIPHPQQDAQIVCTAAPNTEGYFEVGRHDLVIAMPGLGIGIAFEVVQPVGTVNVPPYTHRFVLSPRDDLSNLEPYLDDPDEEPEPPPPIGPTTPAS